MVGWLPGFHLQLLKLMVDLLNAIPRLSGDQCLQLLLQALLLGEHSLISSGAVLRERRGGQEEDRERQEARGLRHPQQRTADASIPAPAVCCKAADWVFSLKNGVD